jgi:hypothetical protein
VVVTSALSLVLILCLCNVLQCNYAMLPINYMLWIRLKTPEWLVTTTTQACKCVPSGDSPITPQNNVFVDHEENNFQNLNWDRAAYHRSPSLSSTEAYKISKLEWIIWAKIASICLFEWNRGNVEMTMKEILHFFRYSLFLSKYVREYGSKFTLPQNHIHTVHTLYVQTYIGTQ